MLVVYRKKRASVVFMSLLELSNGPHVPTHSLVTMQLSHCHCNTNTFANFSDIITLLLFANTVQ